MTMLTKWQKVIRAAFQMVPPPPDAVAAIAADTETSQRPAYAILEGSFRRTSQRDRLYYTLYAMSMWYGLAPDEGKQEIAAQLKTTLAGAIDWLAQGVKAVSPAAMLWEVGAATKEEVGALGDTLARAKKEATSFAVYALGGLALLGGLYVFTR